MTKTNRAQWLLTLPSLLWLAVFVLVPTIIVFVIAFREDSASGGLGAGWSLDALRSLRDPNYPEIAWRTLWVSALTTAICLVLAVPMSMYMARVSARVRSVLLLLVIVPFWTNFLIRIFAWKQILHPEGPLKALLVALHMVSEDAMLLYNPGAVVVVSVYTFLPFAILPMYAAAEKFDFQLMDAARDLGATAWEAFRHVFLPGVRKGLATALLVVFVPMLGSYVIPDIVGGPDGEMIGNRIAQRNFSDRNLPQAAALSALLTVLVLVPVAWQARRGRVVGT